MFIAKYRRVKNFVIVSYSIANIEKYAYQNKLLFKISVYSLIDGKIFHFQKY